jgi:hypothetical protein
MPVCCPSWPVAHCGLLSYCIKPNSCVCLVEFVDSHLSRRRGSNFPESWPTAAAAAGNQFQPLHVLAACQRHVFLQACHDCCCEVFGEARNITHQQCQSWQQVPRSGLPLWTIMGIGRGLSQAGAALGCCWVVQMPVLCQKFLCISLVLGGGVSTFGCRHLSTQGTAALDSGAAAMKSHPTHDTLHLRATLRCAGPCAPFLSRLMCCCDDCSRRALW